MYGSRVGWRKMLGLLALVLMNASPSVGQSGSGLESITTFYVVRHAEKVERPGDVPLRREGYERAVELRELLRNVPLAAIYSTDYIRTRGTVQPIAEVSGIEPWLYPPDPAPNEVTVAAWTSGLIDQHRGQTVLVVSHSGSIENAYSVASIVHQLSGQPVAKIPESEYDNLFEITLYEHGEGEARELRRVLERHRYGPLLPLGEVAVEGKLKNSKDVSALALTDGHLVVGADEDDAIQILRRSSSAQFEVQFEVGRLQTLGDGEELDIESLARVGDTYYVLGSHSRKRKKVEPHDRKALRRPYAENRQRLLADSIEAEVSRRRLFRFTFDPASGDAPTHKAEIDLNPIFLKHEILKVFQPLASKENGIDLEGLAVVGDILYLGFRSPVLRPGFAPVLRLPFDRPKAAELLFVYLGGRGIRELTRVDDGFLIIAGAGGDAPLPYLLYHWDGHDMIPGQRSPEDPPMGRVTLLGRIPTPAGGKAEGLAVLATSDGHYELLVAYDSVVNGGLRTFQASRPDR